MAGVYHMAEGGCTHKGSDYECYEVYPETQDSDASFSMRIGSAQDQVSNHAIIAWRFLCIGMHTPSCFLNCHQPFSMDLRMTMLLLS
jgi:hypothetical protein